MYIDLKWSYIGGGGGGACFKIFQVTFELWLLVKVTWKLPHVTTLQVDVNYTSGRSSLLLNFVNLS